MNRSLIEVIRDSKYFIKITSVISITVFTSLIMTPAAIAINSEIIVKKKEANNSGKALAALYEKSVKLLEDAEKARENGDVEMVDKSLSSLSEINNKIAPIHDEVTQSFKTTRDNIVKRGLPNIILERHQDMVNHYNYNKQELDNRIIMLKEYDSFWKPRTWLRELSEVSGLSDIEIGKKTSMENVDKGKFRRANQPFDPNNLPTKRFKSDKSNLPKTDINSFKEASLFSSPRPMLAALGDFNYDSLIGASDPAYLAKGNEILISQTIKDLAESLEHDPIKIYSWVLNNIVWQPSWGSVQNSAMTLSVKQGNSMDIAALTIALFRASQIPARYVHGTIEVPDEEFKNWAGGFSDSQAAGNYVSSGGIPATALTKGGVIKKFRMEHVWVEVATDFVPSKGVKNYEADTWVQLDPSFKQYKYIDGIDIQKITGYNFDQVAGDYLASGGGNGNEGWITGFQSSLLAEPIQGTAETVASYIKNTFDDPYITDIFGKKDIVQKNVITLPSSLRNHVVVVGARYSLLPSILKQKIIYNFAYGTGVNSESVTLDWAAVNNEKITLAFEPATHADTETLSSYYSVDDIADTPTSIPGYLVQVKPVLYLGEDIILTGMPIPLGTEMDLVTQVEYPTRSQPPIKNMVIAGSLLSVNAISGSVSAEKIQGVQSEMQRTRDILDSGIIEDIKTLTRNDLLANLFHFGNLNYYAQNIAYSSIMAPNYGAHKMIAAGTGTYGYEPEVVYYFGIPTSVNLGSIEFDLPMTVATANDDNDMDVLKQYHMQAGVISSSLEHTISEQLFAETADTVEGISTAKAFQIAASEGQRLYQITKQNIGRAHSNINTDSSTRAEIIDAINAGNIVITHEEQVAVPGWTGTGYAILDPDTYVGAWKIAGGKNGGSLRPVDIIGYMMSSISGALSAMGQGLESDAVGYRQNVIAQKVLTAASKASLFTMILSGVTSLFDVANGNISFSQFLLQVSGMAIGFVVGAAVTASIVGGAGVLLAGALGAVAAYAVSAAISAAISGITSLFFSRLRLLNRLMLALLAKRNRGHLIEV